LKNPASKHPASARRTGSAGARISPSANGAPCARLQRRRHGLEYFPHDHARSRAYRWGEDGIAGISDRHQHICFALALWNTRDPILKERLFGLTNGEGNHGEDVKECYFYLDSTPTHSYMKYLYKYPQAAFPYAQLVEENGEEPNMTRIRVAGHRRFNESRYFDVFVEYAKVSVEEIWFGWTASNRGPEQADLAILPTFWFRNSWSGDGGPGVRKCGAIRNSRCRRRRNR